MEKQFVLIIGAGPAGLTAGYELIKQGCFRPIIIEKLDIAGGLSRTVKYKGNSIDIGGHRFFSKVNRVLDWWLHFLPLENAPAENRTFSDEEKSTTLPDAPRSSSGEEVMLVRNRISRIYFLKKLFPYPINLSFSTLKKLGIIRSSRILFSYLHAKFSPVKPETSLEDFLINRFGKELYKTFFKDYTRKVWGVEPREISAEWGRQRIKGVSLTKIVTNALKRKKPADLMQKEVEASLIEKFLYPKYGPGQLWEKVAGEILDAGGEIHFQHEVTRMETTGNTVNKVVVRDLKNNGRKTIQADYFISTMPVKDLVNSLDPVPPETVRNIANGLEYRDFITVGLLVKELQLKEQDGTLVKDNWIYIQESGVRVGRLQIFNNWSPFMVKQADAVWVGLEYFCQEGDDLWKLSEKELIALAEKELIQLSIIKENVLLDGTAIKVEKAYPSYYGTYSQMGALRDFLDRFENLFLIGRNGMHRYNNQDHSMLTAMEAASQIIKGRPDKSAIWAINTEDRYHEEK